MGFIELDSFCCGCCGLERGCKIICLVKLSYSLLLFSLSVSQDSPKEAHAAYLLLTLTFILLYGVLEKVRIMVMLYLLLRAAAFLLVLAEIMRNLAGMKKFNEQKLLVVMLESGDCVMTLYFYMVVYSFCLHMDDPIEEHNYKQEEARYEYPHHQQQPQQQQPQHHHQQQQQHLHQQEKYHRIQQQQEVVMSRHSSLDRQQQLDLMGSRRTSTMLQEPLFQQSPRRISSVKQLPSSEFHLQQQLQPNPFHSPMDPTRGSLPSPARRLSSAPPELNPFGSPPKSDSGFPFPRSPAAAAAALSPLRTPSATSLSSAMPPSVTAATPTRRTSEPPAEMLQELLLQKNPFIDEQ